MVEGGFVLFCVFRGCRCDKLGLFFYGSESSDLGCGIGLEWWWDLMCGGNGLKKY